MQKLAAIFIIICFSLPALAVIPKKNLPTGTFRKKKDGTIVQYNDKGKKIGIYKLENGSYKKVK